MPAIDVARAEAVLQNVLDSLWCGSFGNNPDRELIDDLRSAVRYLGGYWQPPTCVNFLLQENDMFDAGKVDLFSKAIEAKVKEIFDGLKTDKNEQAQSLYDLSLDAACKDVKKGFMHFAMALKSNLDEGQLTHLFGENHTDEHIMMKACEAFMAKLKSAEEMS